MPVFKNELGAGGGREKGSLGTVDLWNHCCLTLFLRKNYEINNEPNSNKETCKSPPGFVENKSCQTNLISFCDRVTGIVDRGETEGVICFDSSKVFTISLIRLC